MSWDTTWTIGCALAAGAAFIAICTVVRSDYRRGLRELYASCGRWPPHWSVVDQVIASLEQNPSAWIASECRLQHNSGRVVVWVANGPTSQHLEVKNAGNVRLSLIEKMTLWRAFRRWQRTPVDGIDR